MNIILLAPPAAGKGTQSEIFSKKYKLPHISTGDIFREIAREDSEVGAYIRETLKNGDLVKDEITYQLIEDRLGKDDCKNGFIIDGFPRNIAQAHEYDKILKNLGYEVGNVIFINVDKKILEKRITGRRSCEDCKAIYNINDPKSSPKVESVCDNCGGKLYQRSDDNLEAFENRYNMYLEKTEPIIEYYKKQNVLTEVNGDDTVESIFARIDEIISD